MLAGGFAIRPISDELGKVAVAGWAYDTTDRTRQVEVSVYVEGELRAAAIAMEYYVGLESLDVLDGCCGFVIELELSAEAGLFARNVSVVAGNEAVSLPNVAPRETLNSLFFIHIPKTGGTSLRKLLESRVESHKVLPDENSLRRFEGFYPPASVLECYAQDELERYQLLRGHYHYDYGMLLPQPCITITVLREPVSRTLSHIRMLQRNWPPLAELSVDEVIASNIAEIDNLQTRFLGRSISEFRTSEGITPDYVPDTVSLTESDFESAASNLRKIDFVGVQEDILSLVRRLFPNDPDIELGQDNAYRFEESISQASRDLIAEHTQYDSRLYKLARSLSDAGKHTSSLSDASIS
ncbi:hypothetical protein EYC98_20775 [Halieaceae bacterium IMCC14734]|uniref:Sulfotransferase family protein n=1 Tax=Candidatus Litorirhabdus singularis TaxID=2518993 RepID=A0ABT3TLY0_9GAMM|nr:hypothetical protein [Candidatus Litorirhabdus singularis]MCX2983303.1 hypothetical protein [Candidatus Litorirhabdus singularis]